MQVPGLGDSIQAMKAGILEIADIYVINKADLPGAEGTAREIRAMLSFDAKQRELADWRAPVIKVSTKDMTGVDGLMTAIDAHGSHLDASDEGERRRQTAARQEIEDQIDAIVRSRIASHRGAGEELINDVARRSRNPRDAAMMVLSTLSGDQEPA